MLFHMLEAKPYVAHARYMTAGKICEDNIHLFAQGDWLVAMNGTISGFADKKANDTRLALDILKTIPRKRDKIKFMEQWEARFLCVNRKTKEVIRTGKWIEKEGVQYSKNNVLHTFQSRNPYDGYGNYDDSKPYSEYYDYDDYYQQKSYEPKSRNKKDLVSAHDDEYCFINNMWVTRSSLSKGLYGTKKDDRVFGILGDSGVSKVTGNTTLTKGADVIVLNPNINNIQKEASGFVLVSVFGHLLSNYKCREILDKARIIGRSKSTSKLSMVETHGTAYMLPTSDVNSKIIEMLTYQLSVDQYKKLMAAAIAPNYVTPVRRTVVLDDASKTTLNSYIFMLCKKATISAVSSGTRLDKSIKIIEKERTLTI